MQIDFDNKNSLQEIISILLDGTYQLNWIILIQEYLLKLFNFVKIVILNLMVMRYLSNA